MNSTAPLKGVTLVELMVALAVLATVLMMGAPALTNLKNNMAVNSATNELVNLFSYARGEAVARVMNVSVAWCNDSDCEFTASVFTDRDGDCTLDPGSGAQTDERLRVSSLLPDSLKIDNPLNCFVFDSLGAASGPLGQQLGDTDDIKETGIDFTIAADTSTSSNVKRTITVSPTGSISTRKSAPTATD